LWFLECFFAYYSPFAYALSSFVFRDLGEREIAEGVREVAVVVGVAVAFDLPLHRARTRDHARITGEPA
jgi:predicted membrane-bound mannosyltransferase